MGRCNCRSAEPKRIAESSAWKTVSAGRYHTCGIHVDGSLWCWGSGSWDVLGQGTRIDRDVPTQVGNANDWREVSVHEQHSCAIRADRTLWCWGANGDGQLGLRGENLGQILFSEVPAQVGVEHWQSVAAGQTHTCGIRADGELWCWGFHGLGTETVGRGISPAREATNSTWKSVVAGRYHSCGIRNDGTLHCWGEIEYRPVDLRPSLPTQVGGDNDWIQLTAGDGDGNVFSGIDENHTCGIRANGTLWCWAWSPNGSVPVQFGVANDWHVASAGSNHLCGTRGDNTLWCWGANARGQLGQRNSLVEPVQVASDDRWISVSANLRSSCGVRADGTLWCWGDTSDSRDPTQQPLQVGSATNWQSVIGFLGVQTDRSLWSLEQDGPESLGISDWKSVSLSGTSGCKIIRNQDRLVCETGSHTCVVRTDGTLWCRGANNRGQIGDGTATQRYDFVQVGTANDWLSISATGRCWFTENFNNNSCYAHTCGIRGNGNLWCWGANEAGELGIGTLEDQLQPVQAQSSGWQSVSGGCALQQDDSLWCWGGAALGPPGIGPVSVPTREPTSGAWRSVSANGPCAIRSDGSLWCWGYIASILSSTADPKLPLQIGTATDWQTISAGGTHACGLRSGGTLWCFGDASFGQLGDNNAWRTEPVQVRFQVAP